MQCVYCAVRNESLNVVQVTRWLEVSTHPEDPATGHLDEGFPWFSSVFKQMLKWFPKFHVSRAAVPI